MERGQIAERLPPQNTEAEEAVLGSLLIDPEALTRVIPFLGGGDFYIQKNSCRGLDPIGDTESGTETTQHPDSIALQRARSDWGY